MSAASSDQRPAASARPASEAASGPGNICGNSVSTVARQVMRPLRPRRSISAGAAIVTQPAATSTAGTTARVNGTISGGRPSRAISSEAPAP